MINPELMAFYSLPFIPILSSNMFSHHNLFIIIMESKSPRSRAAGYSTCAWHDAYADLPGTKLEGKKCSPLPDGRAKPTRQGHQPAMVGLKEA